MLRWRVFLVAMLLLVLLSQPVLARGSEGGRVVFGDDVTVRSDERIDGDLVVFGGSIRLEAGSQVRGSVLSFGGSIEVNGRVDGDVFSLGGAVDLGEAAVVSGDVVSTNGVRRQPGAVVRGNVMGESRGVSMSVPSLWRPWRLGWHFDRSFRVVGEISSWVWNTLLRTLTMVVLGVVVVLLVPGLTRTAGQTLLAYPGPSVGVGLLTWLAAILALPLLVLTCFGIPLALVGAVGVAIAAVFGWIVAGLVLGERLLQALDQAERQPVLSVVIGLVALAVLSAVPCLGWLVSALVGTWGLGAVVLSRFGTSPYVPAPATLPPALPPVE